jgi:hypothetical protein
MSKRAASVASWWLADHQLLYMPRPPGGRRAAPGARRTVCARPPRGAGSLTAPATYLAACGTLSSECGGLMYNVLMHGLCCHVSRSSICRGMDRYQHSNHPISCMHPHLHLHAPATSTIITGWMDGARHLVSCVRVTKQQQMCVHIYTFQAQGSVLICASSSAYCKQSDLMMTHSSYILLTSKLHE